MSNCRNFKFHCHLLGYVRSSSPFWQQWLQVSRNIKLYHFSGIWGPNRHLSLKITNYLPIFRLRKPLKTSTRLAGHRIWPRDLPNASLVRYHGATSLGFIKSCFSAKSRNRIKKMSRVQIPVPTNLTGVFSWFSSIIKANAGLDFHYHDPFDHYPSNSYIIKLNQWT